MTWPAVKSVAPVPATQCEPRTAAGRRLCLYFRHTKMSTKAQKPKPKPKPRLKQRLRAPSTATRTTTLIIKGAARHRSQLNLSPTNHKIQLEFEFCRRMHPPASSSSSLTSLSPSFSRFLCVFALCLLLSDLVPTKSHTLFTFPEH